MQTERLSGASSLLPTDLVITALGHRAEPTSPWYDPALGHVRTLSARVVDSSGSVVRNAYASGWAAMGARGVLASTMLDAYAVADTILCDHFSDGSESAVEATTVGGEPEPAADRAAAEAAIEVMAKDVELDAIPPEVEEAVRDGRVTQFSDWKAVDAEEVRRGEAMGKERERMGWDDAGGF